MSALAYVVIALASYRLARAIAVDDISLPFRERLFAFAWDSEHPVEVPDTLPTQWAPAPRAAWRTWLWSLLSCPVCIGFWVSAGLYSAWRWWDADAVHAVIAIFAVAGLQTFLATREGA